MANNHGGAGAKFVSVNLNKSYGQPSHHNYPPYSGSYGLGTGATRARPGGHASAGGGMVVLSRNRPLQKAVPKLSIPPPLNLPSLRKEHEKIDSSGAGGGVAGVAGSGSGSRPTSSGMGWTKPSTVALQEKEASVDAQVAENVNHPDGPTKGSGTYMPPSARFGSGGFGQGAAPTSHVPTPERAMVLRGEDFPSLRAALPTSSGPVQKQKEGSFQKQKQILGEESSNEPKGSIQFSSSANAHSSDRLTNGVNENIGQSLRPRGAHVDQAQKHEDPLPLVWLNPRSDWADDERDTGHGFADRNSRDHGLPKTEAFWERDFDMPRSSILPHKPLNNIFERRSQHISDSAKVSSPEVLKVDAYRKDINSHSREDRESTSWRNPSNQKDGSSEPQVVIDRNDAGRRVGLSRDAGKEGKYVPSSFGDSGHHGVVTGNRDSAFGRRDISHGRQGGQQHWNHSVESTRYGTEQSTRYRGDAFQNSAASKSLFSSGGKGLPMNDPLLNFGREKRTFSKSERSYTEDPYQKDFNSSLYDEKDPFTGNLVGIVKRKKEVVKQPDFHDPVRESFEAELERVQKMQEMERQRIIEEQERAMEQARREEEERRKLIREEEERRRRMEEEAREAAWRAEQERLEAIQKAEEQKIAREEEKKRMLLEEERRKQAAKQKLLELEARIAKRQVEVGKSDSCADEEVPIGGKDKDVSVAADLDNWEDSERMVERITTSASSDSSALSRAFDRPQFSRDSSSSLMDRGKTVNPWRRDAFEASSNSSFLLHEQENGHHGPRRDASIGGRVFPRKELYGGGGYMSSRTSFRGGMQDPNSDGFPHVRDHRWNPSGDADPYNRNKDIESDFYENVAEKYGDPSWGQGHPRSNIRSPYSERLYLNSESDDLYSYGRSRYSMRQPRVLPPPSLTSAPKSSVRGQNEPAAPSSSLESTARSGYYDGSQEKLEQSDLLNVQQEIMAQKLDKNDALRCDSQSSLSVSSPPSSPTHLSHDELDESAGSLAIPSAAEGKDILLSGSEPEASNDKPRNDSRMAASNPVSADEDEDWSLENNDEMQEQEEYDEDDDGYQEEDEVHEGDEDLTQEFEQMHLEEKSTSDMMENLVLGFNEGVEVRIPSDEFERDSRTDENRIGTPEMPVGVVEKQGSVDGVIHEQEMAIEESVVQPLNASHKSPVSNVSGDPPVVSAPSAQHMVPSAVEMASSVSSGQSMVPALSSVPSQADLPIKLQFGLFSGPSLIPSPIPAIQIGSIQMPLHLHPPVGPSISHIHPSQPPPLFQFGQLRYTSPASQGILSMAPQPMSFVQPNLHHTHYNLNQNTGSSSMPNQSSQENSANKMKKDDGLSLPVNNHSGIVSMMPDLSYENWSRGSTTRGKSENNVVVCNSQNNISHPDNKNSEEKGNDNCSEPQFAPASSQGLSGKKDTTLSKAPGTSIVNRGKKMAYSIRNSGSRSSFPAASDASRSGSNEFQRKPRRAIQRTEFRVRENIDGRLTDDKLNNKGSGNFARSGYRRSTMSGKSLKQVVGSESSLSSFQDITSDNRMTGRGAPKHTLTKTHASSSTGEVNLKSVEVNLKRNISEEDVDAPLQSGIVRVFKQPGIEAPSDEDDFIEVRSKRQMLNDRREQREKEIKAKSRVAKQPRRSRSSVQGTMVSSTTSKKNSASLVGEASHNLRSDFVGLEGRGLANKEVSTGFSTMVSQPLAPIGTPAMNNDVHTEIRPHTSKSPPTGSAPTVSGAGKDLAPNLFEAKSKVIDNVQTSLGGWGNIRADHQVMPLTQTQLDEAMKPARYDTHATSVGDHSISVGEPTLPSTSILTKEKSVSSSASPINSLLAGEKIQFGAVTSPTVLPPSSRVISHGIGAPGSFRPDTSQNLSKAENDCTLFFKKDKHSSESCLLLEDCEAEAEAEAAASAVAVAAISTDEIIGNGLGPVSVSDSKNFGGAVVDGGNPSGLAGDQQVGGQSRPEESLAVSLPADLSVETPPISLWPPLPSPQSSSTQMLSHFPGAPPSHYPFYEMNHPIMGGPVFAFGPHEESGGTQSQSQKSSVSGSGHIGTWQHHSGIDSFYGPPAGFAGPFISPPGGIPGVQAPPHMVVYNHYAPVGQFGQVGLSFMGATYIPSGKQPDWKHNPASSSMGMSEGEMNTMNMASGQRNPPNMAPIQHLAPGSPLLPMGSPLTMFDVPPFQTAPDMSVQARWSHVPASPLHSVPMSLPLQQQAEGAPQFSSHGGHPIDQSSVPTNRFSEPQASTPSDSGGRAFSMSRDSTITQFPDDLGLVDSSGPLVSNTTAPVTVGLVSSGNTVSNAVGKATDAIQRGTSFGINNNSSNGQNMNAFKNQHQHHQQGKNLSSQQYNHSGGGGYGYQRGGGVSQKSSSMGEWAHRRTGYGRNQPMGAEKNFPSSSTKMKQIYVAKQPSSGTSSTAG